MSNRINKVTINGKEYDGNNVSISKEGLFINGEKIDVQSLYFDKVTYKTPNETYQFQLNKKKKRPKVNINWKPLGILIFELLKAFLTTYIIFILANPINDTEKLLSFLIGFMWYTTFIKGDYGEKDNEKK